MDIFKTKLFLHFETVYTNIETSSTSVEAGMYPSLTAKHGIRRLNNVLYLSEKKDGLITKILDV